MISGARIQRRGESGPAVLSTAQKRIWLLHQFDPASPISNRPLALRLTGTLDPDTLLQALNEIARRHEILRTVFPVEDGEARQVALPAAAIPFETQDLRGMTVETREEESRRIAAAGAIHPFDLATGPLARVKLLQLGSQDHVLLVLMHHIVFDGWSENVFVNELKVLYRAFALRQTSPLPDPPIQYADFAAWQQQRLMDGAIDGQMEYWRQQLAGAPSVLNLPADFNAPAQPRWHGGSRSLLLSSSVTEGLKRTSREERVSLFMTLLATLQLLLARYTGQEDIVIGVPVAGRNRVETEDLIGCFMNVLVFRTEVSAGLTVRKLLGRVRDTSLAAFANQEVPFERLVEQVRPERLPDRWPFFQTMFQLRNLPRRDSVEVEGLRFEPFEFDAGVIGGLDLSVEIKEAPRGLRCSFRYDASLFAGETIERIMGHFENLLDGIVRARDQRVSKLPMLGDAERRRLLVDWNDTRVAFPQNTSIHHLFEAQAERAPEAIAVASEHGRLTYRDLNRRANQVARHLRESGARPETIVAISMERSPELLAGLLGILKSGAAYLPLDPAHPKDRLAYMMRDAGAAMLLTQRPLLARLPATDRVLCLDEDDGALSRESGQNLPRIESADNLAYVIYTSGTVGEPKGVMIQHRSVVNHLLWRRQYFPLTQSDRLLQRASIGFDDSVWELFEPLASGATLVLASSRQDSDTHYLIDLIVRHQITAACFIPSLLEMLVEERRFGECQSLRRVTTGAEVLPVDAPDRFFARVRASLFNGYGPTETTIGCSYYRCEPGTKLRSIPIGRPIANAEIYILDRDLEPSPIGVPGELFIGGAGLARGYIGQPDLTAEKFIPHPFSAAGGARLYRTGDLARYLPDGNIEFLGRIDQQVKIRGYRIELGEVEAVLAQHPSVRQAALTVWEPRPGDKALAAYVVAREGSVITPSEARAFAHRKLPAYMIPSDWVVLGALPLQRNGKVNRGALPRPVRVARPPTAAAGAPRNKLQAQLRTIWEDVLKIGNIGIRQNFFDLGGHSLLALKAFSLVERQLGLRLPLAALLAAPTIEMLAEAIEQKGYESSWASLVPIQPNGSRLPLYCLHGNDGDVLFYRDLALRLGEHQPLYGLQSPGLKDAAAMPATVEELAALYVGEIRSVHPGGLTAWRVFVWAHTWLSRWPAGFKRRASEWPCWP